MEESLSTTSLKGGMLPDEPASAVPPSETPLETTRTPTARGPRISQLSNISKEGTAEDYFHDAEGEIAGHEGGGAGAIVPPPLPPKENQQPGNKPSRKRHQELTASNLQAIPNAEELAPGIRLGAGGNVDPEPAEPGQSAPPSSSGHAAYSEEDEEEVRPSIADADALLLDSEIDEHGRRHSLLTSASGGRAAEEFGRAPSLGPSASMRGGPSITGPAGRRQAPTFSNTVGHFGKGGEPVAGVPPELDPRGPNFRPPSPSGASIYSVSVQAPASPKAVENEGDDYVHHHLHDLTPDEPSTSSSSDFNVPLVSYSLTPSFGVPGSAAATIGTNTPSSVTGMPSALSSYPPTPGSTSSIPSGIPASTLDHIRANPRGLVYSVGGPVPISSQHSRQAFTSSPSEAATAGSEDAGSMTSVSSLPTSSRPPSIRGEPSSPPLSIPGSLTTNPGESREMGLEARHALSTSSASSSARSRSSDAGMEDGEDGSPSGGPATSFAGTSVGASSHSAASAGQASALAAGAGYGGLASSRFMIPSIAPSEAGSAAGESELGAVPEGQSDLSEDGAPDMSADDRASFGARTGFTATGPLASRKQLPLSFGPGLAAFRSALAASATSSRAGSTAATVGTSSPTRSVISSGSAARSRRDSSSSVETVGSSIMQSESGAPPSLPGGSSAAVMSGLSTRRMSRQLSSAFAEEMEGMSLAEREDAVLDGSTGAGAGGTAQGTPSIPQEPLM